MHGDYKLVLFPYAPRRWQLLAHTEGGIPAALRKGWYFYLLLPPFLLSMLIAALVNARKSDVIHANWSICGAIAGIAGKLAGVPVLTTIRGSDLERAKSSWMDRLVLRVAIATNKALVAVNHSQQQSLLAVAPRVRAKLHTILNGVGEDFYAIGKSRIPHPGPTRLLTVGRLIAGKGIDTVLLALTLADYAQFTLSIVGSGPEETKLKELAERLGVHHRVCFAGSVSHHELPRVFGAHDIFILASQAEGRPNVVLEAMATCTPVISTHIPGVAGLIEPDSTGRTFPVGDAKSLARLLDEARKDPLKTHEMAHQAMNALIHGGQTWEKCAADYTVLYRRLAGNE